jgi:hypothetical protein
VLSVPLAAYYTARKRFQVAEHILESAIQQFEAQWQALSNQSRQFAIASRSHEPDHSKEIAALICTPVCLQVRLSGTPNERFSICIRFGTASFTEEFIL